MPVQFIVTLQLRLLFVVPSQLLEHRAQLVHDVKYSSPTQINMCQKSDAQSVESNFYTNLTAYHWIKLMLKYTDTNK